MKKKLIIEERNKEIISTILDTLIQYGIVNNLLRIVLRSLGKRHSVNTEYIIDVEIEEEFEKCLKIAFGAFVKKLLEGKSLKDENSIKFYSDIIRDYLSSSKVAEEISKLLDPGLEIFDPEVVISELKKLLSKHSEISDLKDELIYSAWDVFQRAFSFASRSTPKLREFLRASYEVGSYRTLTNISDVLDRLNIQIKLIENEEEKLKHSVRDFSKDLQISRDWALKFKMN